MTHNVLLLMLHWVSEEECSLLDFDRVPYWVYVVGLPIELYT